MTNHFNDVTSFEDLKAKYRALAFANHPDRGGDGDVMKAINNEYDRLFPMWKHRSEVVSDETAASTRSEFYTANGWKGENYNPQIRLKELAHIVREYLSDIHNDYKFSVTTDRGSMTQSLRIAIMETPADVFAEDEEDSEKDGNIQGINYRVDRNPSRFTPEFAAMVLDVQRLLDSYNRDDSDSMSDYFDRHFYDSFDLGKWDKPYKIVPREKKKPTYTEYETVDIVKTRTFKFLKPQEIEDPAEFAPGQHFRLKISFRYGCNRGYVYQIDQISNGLIRAYKLGKGYKNVCKGDIRGNCFHVSVDRLRGLLEKDSIRFVELVEVTGTEEYTSSVRRPKKKTGLATVDEQPGTHTATTQDGPLDYTITPDKDTRDDSPLWVLRITKTLERDAYKTVADSLKSVGGYYSKFKHGFIFREDPAGAVAELFTA